MTDAPERIWIEAGYGCPYFYEAYELPEAGSPVTGYIRADLVEALEAEIVRLRGELMHIATGEGFYGVQAAEYKAIARAALTPGDKP